MSIATDSSGSEIRSSKTNSSFPQVAVISVVFAGLYAAIRLRDRRRGERPDGSHIPAAIREDIGLPPREKGARGWWEWR